MSDKVYIFDTTLRDGEQSPGCSMTTPEKLRMARKLVDLGVDLIEAGFPIASHGDYEAVKAVKREFPEAMVRGYAAARFRAGHDIVVLGHFHIEKDLAGEAGGRILVLPEWKGSRRHLEIDPSVTVAFVDSTI